MPSLRCLTYRPGVASSALACVVRRGMSWLETCVRALCSLLACVHACVRVRLHACTYISVRACVRARALCVRERVRACACACEHARNDLLTYHRERAHPPPYHKGKGGDIETNLDRGDWSIITNLQLFTSSYSRLLERALSGDILAGGNRSRGREKPVLENELSVDIAAGVYRSRGRESLCWREAFLGIIASRGL